MAPARMVGRAVPAVTLLHVYELLFVHSVVRRQTLRLLQVLDPVELALKLARPGGSTEANYRRGLAFDKQKDYANAAREYMAGIKIDQNDLRLWKRLGVVYLRYKKNKQARKCFERYLQLNPNDEKIRMVVERLSKD